VKRDGVQTSAPLGVQSVEIARRAKPRRDAYMCVPLGSARGTNLGSARGTKLGSARGTNLGSARGTNLGFARGRTSASLGVQTSASLGVQKSNRGDITTTLDSVIVY